MPELTKDDLVLLMESYKNMITMHQALLDQQGHTIEKLDGIIIKQESIASKQTNACNSLGQIVKRMEDYHLSLTESNTTVLQHSLKSIEEHGKITNKVYIGWIGMGTIIISFVGIMITMLHYGNDIIKAVERIPIP